jgi:dihydrofolate synthase/folylpolyglutamate synthase
MGGPAPTDPTQPATRPSATAGGLAEWPGALTALPPPDATLDDPAYHAALAWLYGLSGVPRAAAAIRADQPRKVARTRHLLACWGDPQRAYPAVLVAGSKGKGSTAAMLAAILQAAGARVGRYTQPHLVSYRERIWVDGAFIEADAVVRLTTEVRPLVAAAARQRSELGPYTTFEVGTVLALQHFARRGVEVAVVEVGVGGTHDATNALDPVVSVITPISADHLDTLGPTLADVARAKAGILRSGRPAAIGPQVPAVAAVLVAAVRALDVSAQWIGQEWTWVPCGDPPASAPFTISGPGRTYPALGLPLLGRHQRDNAALAVATAQALAPFGHGLTADAVARGLASVAWPGRIQLVSGSPPLIVDGAHNAASAHRLAETVAECFPGRPITLVVGCTGDKDLPAIIAPLARAPARVIATRADHPRAASSDLVAAAARTVGAVAVERTADVVTALRRAAAQTPAAGLIVVAGSLFVAGEALAVLGTAGGPASGAP